jgi:hypothetical protein
MRSTSSPTCRDGIDNLNTMTKFGESADAGISILAGDVATA